MDKATRNAIERATQQARKLLDEDFSSQLEGTFDVLRSGVIAPTGGAHLSARQQFQRDKIVAAIEHKRAAGATALEAVTDYVRDAAFTTVNRFVALKMLEARQLVQECITKGEQSAGFREFCGMAPGVALLPDAAGYRLYVESLFDEFSTEIKVLFDRRDAASVLWPKRQTFESLLTILNAPDLSGVWGEDETIGWVYQFFNSGEERKKMRDESQVPRNSRELAVRNQFFTPRYVVQFLVDNTLGRLWLEMHGEQTRLTELCEYLAHSADGPVQARQRKDPRDLRILDPACGSGHFLLYSFDLLLGIYEEAWSAQGVAPKSEATGRSLQDDYSDLIDLRRAVPRLIVEHNLHGVDIDPRCAQIAALALWLRAQRAWKDLGIAAVDRPRIQRTHIVVAEPMPGDAALVDEFAERLDPPLLRDLFKKMVRESRLSGELGLLLRVEDAIALELSRAREQFVKQRQTSGFLPGMEPVAQQGSLDLSGIDDDGFFHEAEARIVEALHVFAETASGSANVRRRLFAGDAAEGIALIDLARTRFDVVLMNPPFGAGSLAAKNEFDKSFPRTKNDVYAAFVERGIQLLHPRGLLGAITSRTGFFLSTFQKWREEILLREAPPVVFADLGYGVLDSAMVEVAAYCLEKGHEVGEKTVFLRALEATEKAPALRTAIHEPASALGRQRFDVDVASFAGVPGSPFAYWAGQSVLRTFASGQSMGNPARLIKQGLASADDGRFLRLWWETEASSGWMPFAKGGVVTPFYADIYLVVNWRTEGEEIAANLNDRGGIRSNIWMLSETIKSCFGKPGLTWSLRARGLAFRALPASSAFSHKGPSIFSPELPATDLLALLGLANSKCFEFLVAVQIARAELAQSWEVGVIRSAPLPIDMNSQTLPLAGAARRGWSLKRQLDTRTETSHAFALPALLQIEGDTLAARVTAWAQRVHAIDAELSAIGDEIDESCMKLYRIDDADRRAIIEGFGEDAEVSGEPGEDDADADDEQDLESNGAEAGLSSELISWAVGVAFGRFDVRLTSEPRALPPEPEPFDPLPANCPAMLTGADGSSLAIPPAGYPVAFPVNGILVDDPGHAQNLTAAVRSVFNEVFGPKADSWWNDVAALLNPKSHDLRVWLATNFFEYHLKRYSKSRRKAPILWQLAVPSGRYSVWLYAHRLTHDSFFQIQNDVVTPKLAHEERRLTTFIQSAGSNPSATERKEIAEQEAFVEELRSFLDEVKRIAPLWNPVLEDGVSLTMAPLWRLVPHHKPWQKELKSKWDELAAGKCDWAHVAMHLWPERVVPKCAIDRSLAIAHGLEDVFWAEGGDGKWSRRPIPTRPVDELVRERTSIAVKAALQGLTEAPAPNGSKVRTRRSSS